MDYRESPPRSKLAPYVRCVWRFRAGGPGEGPERIVPDGRCELVVHVGRPFAEIAADGTQATQPRALFAGQVTRPLHLASRGAPHVIGVRFHPAGARAFLGRPVDGATDRRLALRDARELATVLAGLPWREAAKRVQDYVAHRIERNGAMRDAIVERCVAMIEASGGESRIEALVDAAGVGRRQLERRFAQFVGVGPARLAAILRFRRVFDVIERDTDRPWTDAALAAGFFDQSHFIREFRRYVGCTPTAFVREARGLTDALARPQADVATVQVKRPRRG